MFWPFKRKSKLPFLQPKTTWSVGDIAECTDTFELKVPVPLVPSIGSQAMVLDVRELVRMEGDYKVVYLRLLGYETYWTEHSFRKVLLSETGADRKVSACKPVGEKV